MKTRRPHWRSRLLIAALSIASMDRECLAGQSAEILFPISAVQQILISPGGDWIIAHAIYGKADGILVQSTSTSEITNVFATRMSLGWINWIDRNTIIAEFVEDSQRRTLVIRFRQTETGLEFDEDWIVSEGWLVDPLPLIDKELIWGTWERGSHSIRRVDVRRLINHGRKRNPRDSVGPRLASVKGDSARWIVDRNGNPRAVERSDDGKHTILVRDEGETDFREVYSFDDNDEASEISLKSLSPDQRHIIASAYNGNDTKGLFEFDPATGKLGETLFLRDDADVSDLVVDPITRELIAAAYEKEGETHYHYFASYAKNLLADLSDEFPKESIAVISSSADRRSSVFWVSGATNPGTHYFHDSRAGKTTKIAQRGAAIDRESLAPVNGFVVKSQDGTNVEAYLTLPESTRGEVVPLVVMPHGGPIDVRDRKQYDPFVQYLVSWGFAVLQPNYRGSAGYGRKFRESAKKAWAKGIEDDIDAAVEYAMALPEIDAERVCMFGGSYGGFSAVASVVRHKDRYRCAISLNGVSDVPLLYDSSDMADSRRVMAFYEEFVGDLKTERENLIAVSPAYHVAEIETPIFMIYGTADRRVDPDHSHRMLLMLETYGKEHDSMELEGMAHSPTRDEAIKIARAVRGYLTRYLLPSEEFRPDPEIESPKSPAPPPSGAVEQTTGPSSGH